VDAPNLSYTKATKCAVSCGRWRAGAEVRRVHFAEVLNASHGIIMLIINNYYRASLTTKSL
jgi:hypothetical protein